MPEDENESWYLEINDNVHLMQGDLVRGCPYVILPRGVLSSTTTEVEIIEYDVIILTQSCDLENNKVKFVLVAPFSTMTEYVEKYPHFRDDNLKESVRRGYQPALVILDKLDDDFLIVDFKSAYSVPLTTLMDIIRDNPMRSRLKPPYREFLSQEFAKFYMRVGLPKVLPYFSGSVNNNYCDRCPVHHAVRE